MVIKKMRIAVLCLLGIILQPVALVTAQETAVLEGGSVDGLKVGIFAIGLDTYWDQFEGLKENLLGYHKTICDGLKGLGAEVVDAGLVDHPSKAAAAASLFRQSEVEMIFLYVSTYALSSTVLPVVRDVGVPVVVLSLQPVAQLDYESFNALGDRGLMTGRWLEHCQACSVPEIASVFNRAGIPYEIVTGFLDDQEAWAEIEEWVQAGRVVHAMRQNRMGVLGHYYQGMLDVYSDMTLLTTTFGTHFELLEMCELKALRDAVEEDRVQAKLEEFQAQFAVSPECEPSELRRAALTSCALDALVAKRELGSMAYYYEGQPGNDYEDIVTSIIAGNTLLTGRNVPVAGECEIKNAHAMKILDLLGAGGSFSEFYLTDFVEDLVFLGHDGPAHFAIAEGPVGLVPLPVFHGKPGKGLSIQMSVQNGPVTLLSVVHNPGGTISLLVAEGESVPGPVLQIGNTNSRYQFPISAKDFVNSWAYAGPAHHCAIGVGHWAEVLRKVGGLLGIDVLIVC